MWEYKIIKGWEQAVVVFPAKNLINNVYNTIFISMLTQKKLNFVLLEFSDPNTDYLLGTLELEKVL